MPEVDLGFGKSNTIRVRLSDEEARDFHKVHDADYAEKRRVLTQITLKLQK